MKNIKYIMVTAFIASVVMAGCEGDEVKSNQDLLTKKVWILIENQAVASDGDVLIDFQDTLLNNPHNEFYYRYKDDRYIFSSNGLFVQEDGVNNDHGAFEHPYGHDEAYQVFQDVDTLGEWSLSDNALNLSPYTGANSSTSHPHKVTTSQTFTIESIDENYLVVTQSGTFEGENVTLRRRYKQYFGMY